MAGGIRAVLSGKKTAERLKAMGVEYYLPIQSEIRQWSDRRKRVDRLVIPMMISCMSLRRNAPAAYLTSYQSIHGIAR